MRPARHVLTARSVLYVAGETPARFDLSAASDADLVVLDLEDTVSEPAKVEARRAVATWLLAGHEAAVRINRCGDPHQPHDVAAVRGLPALAAVVVPKAEDPAALTGLHAELGGHVPLVALIETAAGVGQVGAIAAAEGVRRLGFGQQDYAADVGSTDDPLSTLFARSSIVNASRAAGLPGPIDGLTTDLLEPSVTMDDARRARRLGFTGKACVHAHQVEVVNEAFLPTRQETTWARAVVEAAVATAGGVTVLAGHVIDPATVDRARRILALVNERRHG